MVLLLFGYKTFGYKTYLIRINSDYNFEQYIDDKLIKL
jgi:hypothetical protein